MSLDLQYKVTVSNTVALSIITRSQPMSAAKKKHIQAEQHFQQQMVPQWPFLMQDLLEKFCLPRV